MNTDSASLTSDRAKTYVGPRLQGRHVHLRAVLPEDLTYLRLVETSSELAPQWRLRGSTPSPQDWAQGSTAGVLAQFLALANRDRAKVGLVTAYNANFRDGHAQLAAVAFDPARPGPLMPIAIGLFIEYVFRCWRGCPARRGTSRRRSRCDGQAVTSVTASSIVGVETV